MLACPAARLPNLSFSDSSELGDKSTPLPGIFQWVLGIKLLSACTASWCEGTKEALSVGSSVNACHVKDPQSQIQKKMAKLSCLGYV